MHLRLLLPLLAVLVLGASTGAQQQQASSTISRAASSTASRSGSASASATASAGNGTSSGNGTATNGTMSSNSTTGGNSTNTTTTRPPITATASEITTGALAGTALAPAPNANVPGIAKGPDDSYVNKAQALAAGSFALTLVLGGALLF